MVVVVEEYFVVKEKDASDATSVAKSMRVANASAGAADE